MSRLLTALLLLTALGCGDDARPTDAGTEAGGRDSATGDAMSGDSAVLDARIDGRADSAVDASMDASRSDAAGDASTTAVPPLCVADCDSAADCDTGVAPYRAANYRCDVGACVWLGCRNDADCSGMPCRGIGTLPPVCVQACTTPSDCGDVTADTDADNYACDAGGCIWQGCNDDDECVMAHGAGFVCAASTALGAAASAMGRFCLESCTRAADCERGTPLTGADNYTCVDDVCAWTGCNDDAECRAAFMMDGFVCH